MNLYELFVKIGAETSGLEKGISKAGQLVKGFAKVSAAAVGAAATGLTVLAKQAVSEYSEYEQLAGGAEKIFNGMDTSKIISDAINARKDLQISENDYLRVMNDVGATFASTMGAEAGYDTARKGLMAISDYATGTGKNIDELSNKFTLITRSTSSYQSIADQFSGILPATSKGFLEQAQAAGFLEKKYKDLTEVPINEYQAAVADMLVVGVDALHLTGNAAMEAEKTISGSLNLMRASWKNFLTALGDKDGDIKGATKNLVDSAKSVFDNIKPVAENALEGLADFAAEAIPKIGEVLIEEIPVLAKSAVKIVVGLKDALIANLPKLKEFGVDVGKTIILEVEKAIGGLFGVGEDEISAFNEEAVAKIEEGVSAIMDAVTRFTDWCSEHKTLIEDVALAVGTFATVFVTAKEAVTLFNNAMTFVKTAIAALTSPTNLVIIGIAALIAIIVLCIKHWDEIKAKAEEVLNAIKVKIDEFKEAVSGKIEEIKQFFSDAWDGIKGFFSDAYDVGSGIVSNILSGIQSVWDTITTWVSNAWASIKSIFTIDLPSINIGGGGLFGGGNGSVNAGGLDYVPYNGFNATLHRGESVLTAREAERWRSGGGDNSLSAVSQPVEIPVSITLDGRTLANQLYKYNITVNRNHGKAMSRA